MTSSAARSGLWPFPSEGALRIALYAGVPLAAGYLLLKGNRDDYRTDFDGFLKAVEEPGSTGHNTAAASKSSPAGTGLTSGSIDKFFKDADEDTRNPLDFDSFLKGAAKSSGASHQNAQAQKAVPPAPKEQAKPHHIRVAVLYGTEFGFSKEVAEIMAGQLKSTGAYW